MRYLNGDTVGAKAGQKLQGVFYCHPKAGCERRRRDQWRGGEQVDRQGSA